MNGTTQASDNSVRRPASRREFLARVALMAGVPVALGVLGYRRWQTLAHDGASAPRPSLLPGLNAFTPLIGEEFSVAGTVDQPASSLVLAKAEALKHHQAGVSERFSLRFIPRSGQLVESRIRELFHPVLGRLDLFLCSVGSAGRFGEDQISRGLKSP